MKPIVKILKVGNSFKALFRDATHIMFDLETDSQFEMTHSLTEYITKQDQTQFK